MSEGGGGAYGPQVACLLPVHAHKTHASASHTWKADEVRADCKKLVRDIQTPLLNLGRGKANPIPKTTSKRAFTGSN